MESTRKLYADYQNAAAACSRKSLKVRAVLSLLLAVVCLAGAGLLTQVPELIPRLPVSLPIAMGGLGSLGVVFLVLSILQLNRGRRYRKELDASTRLLQEIFARHLGDSSVSQEAMSAFELRMGEFLRLCGAIDQSRCV